MKRLNLIVEGSTEEAFVNKVLSPYFAVRGIFISAQRVFTSSRHGAKGGVSSFQKIQNDVIKWLQQDTSAWVSTIFDLYGLPVTFPGYAAASNLANPYAQVHHLEREWLSQTQQEIGSQVRFVPYIQLHEFEALLFSAVEPLLDGLTIFQDAPQVTSEIQQILSQFNDNPELINNSPQTAPSKRLKAMCSSYSKTLHGPLIAEVIGIEIMRKRCEHFNHWLEQLEAI